MKRACRLCSASYDHFASITPQGSSGRILSASRTVLKTHHGYYIMYKEELQAPIFYNSVKSLRKLEQTGSTAALMVVDPDTKDAPTNMRKFPLDKPCADAIS